MEKTERQICTTGVLCKDNKSTKNKIILIEINFLLCIFVKNMIMEEKYDYEAVKELLDWAQELFDSKKYPSGEFELSSCAIITDCGMFLRSMISMVSRNWENPTFYPVVDQLRTFRVKVTEPEAVKE